MPSTPGSLSLSDAEAVLMKELAALLVSTGQRWRAAQGETYPLANLTREAAALVDPALDAAGVSVCEGACAPAWLVKVVLGVFF
jgi:hypothetical protein